MIHISDSQTVEKYENNVHKFEYLNFGGVKWRNHVLLMDTTTLAQ